jgi:MYXO-CTERM domain-containing protein
MTKTKRMANRMRLVLLSVAATGLLVVTGAGQAAAQQTCVNDDDCPNPACGGDVCTWGSSGMFCEPAGSKPAGEDGWCTTDADCKCAGMGAKCAGVFCTFTKPLTSGTGGASGTGSGGASGTGTGGASGTGTGGASANPPKDDGGGCSVAGDASSGSFGGAAGVALLGALLAIRLRRRRA